MLIYPSNQGRIIEMEERSLNAWPAINEVHHQGCVFRFSNGYTKRANSANPVYFTGNCPELIQYAEEAYASRSLPTVFKMISHKRYALLDSILEQEGYSIIDRTNVKIIDLRETAFSDSKHVIISDRFQERWIHDFIRSSKLEQKAETVETILKKIQVKTIVASIVMDDEIIGFGFGAIESNVVGIFDVFINEQYRGNGYGRALMSKLLHTAQQRKCIYSYLQVMNDNVIAGKLYQSLGYKQYYNYWYRVKNI